MKKINRKDLVEVVAEEGHLSKKDSRVAVDLVFDLIEKSILEGEEVNITNFGVFTPITKQSRDGTDPKSHQRIRIKEKKTVTFRLSKQLKQKLMKKKYYDAPQMEIVKLAQKPLLSPASPMNLKDEDATGDVLASELYDDEEDEEEW